MSESRGIPWPPSADPKPIAGAGGDEQQLAVVSDIPVLNPLLSVSGP